MNIEKYLWTRQNLDGVLWANGLHWKAIEVHNQIVVDLIAHLDQQGHDADYEEFKSGIIKELNEIKQGLSDIEKGNEK